MELVKIDSATLEVNGVGCLEKLDAILVPGGFGSRGIEGKILAAQYAREQLIPYLGLCLGMQIATIEYARHVLGLEDAHSTEFNPETTHPVIALLDEQQKVTKLGGTMRLGAQECKLKKGTKAADIYQKDFIQERHRHRYEFNNEYRELLEKDGNFVVSGTTPNGSLVEVIELKNHPFFVACQFHPEFQSKPLHPHPLFKAFVAAAITERNKRVSQM